jgi:UDP-N-acetylglucosamine 3-dehydrogenase
MNREPRLAVIGLGFGANHARVLSEMSGVCLTAVCDANVERLSTIAARFSVGAYADPDDMLAKERPDAVVIATPASTHEKMALIAIAAGCAVLVEKPFAESLGAGQRIVRAGLAAGKMTVPGHIERFNPAIRELARLVRGGETGPVLHIVARRTSATRLPPRDVNVVHDSAIHDIDAMRFVLGTEVEEVYATSQSGIAAPHEDLLQAQLRFREAGGKAALGSLEVNWLSPRRLRDLSVLGERGLFVADYAAQSLDYYPTPHRRSGPVQGWEASRSRTETEPISINIEPREQLVEELSAFVASLRDGCPAPVTPEDGLAALAIADALTTSARSLLPVRPAQWSLDD